MDNRMEQVKQLMEQLSKEKAAQLIEKLDGRFETIKQLLLANPLQ